MVVRRAIGIGILATACSALMPTLALASIADDTAVYQTPLVPLTGDETDETLVSRCSSFFLAARIVRQIMASNPVTGRDGADISAFYFTDAPDVLNYPAPDSVDDETATQFLGDYLDAFGPIQPRQPETITDSPLWKADLKICMDRVAG